MLVSDFAAFDSPTSPRAFSQPDPPTSTLDSARLGSSLSLRQFQCLGLLILVCGLSRLGFSVLALDSAHLGLSTLLHGPAKLGLALFALDFAALDSPPLVHGCT